MTQTIDEKVFDSQFSAIINHCKTEFVFKKFENKFFILITQFGKMSNIYSVKFEERNPLQPVTDNVPLTITNRFGEDVDGLQSAIQFLINNSNLKNCPNDIIFSLGLNKISGEVLREIVIALNLTLKINN